MLLRKKKVSEREDVRFEVEKSRCNHLTHRQISEESFFLLLGSRDRSRLL